MPDGKALLATSRGKRRLGASGVKNMPSQLVSIPAVCLLALLELWVSSPFAYAQARAYVTNNGDNTVSIIDISSNSVVDTVRVGSGPEGVAITPDGTRAYVANDGGAVWVLDTSNNAVLAKVTVGGDPYGVAITPDGTRVYVTEDNAAAVSVIDTSSNAVVAKIGVVTTPAGVAITPDGTRAYVASAGTLTVSPTVSVIDTSSNAVVAKVAVGGIPLGVAITPDGTRAYVAVSVANISGGTGTVAVIDTSSNTVVDTVNLGGQGSFGVAITPDGTRAYVANGTLIGAGANSGFVSVIDTSNNTVVAKVSVADPLGVAITPDGTRAYVANDSNFAGPSSVSVIDTSSNSVIATVGVGGIPTAVAIKKGSASPGLIPSIASGGIIPGIVQPGEWVSIYGTNLASGTTIWNGDFPKSLGGTSVTVDGKAAYLLLVSPGQINLQVPDDAALGPVPVVVTTAVGSGASTVTLAQFGPSFFLLDTKHVAGIILRSDGSGSYGGGSYDIIGPRGTSLGYQTVAAKAGDTIELFGTGFGPTDPEVAAGQAFSGSASTTYPVMLQINGVSVVPAFAGLSGAGVYQLNLTVPSGLGTGDVPLQATVRGVQTPSGVVMSLR